MNDTLKDYHAGQIADEAARRLKDPALEWHRKQKEKDDRIEQLEQLCLDLWICAHEPKCCNCPKYQGEDTNCEVLNAQRMDALGLLEGED